MMTLAEANTPLLVAMAGKGVFYGLGLPDDLQAGEVCLLGGRMPAPMEPLLLCAAVGEQVQDTEACLLNSGHPRPAFWKEMKVWEVMAEERPVFMWLGGRAFVIGADAL